MNHALAQYVAQSIVQDLRAGTRIDDAVLDAVYCYPTIDAIRALIEPRDWPAIKLWAASGSQSAWDFAVGGLTRRIAYMPEVQEYLLGAWHEYPDFAHRYHVLFRILDLDICDDKFVRDLWAFVKANMHQFVFERVGWYGGRGAVLASVKQRLSDATFPQGKAWVYLVSAMADYDTGNIRKLLDRYANSSHELTREVAQYLIDNFEDIT